MVNDPQERYEKVREEHGEAAAAQEVIKLSKRVAAIGVAIVVIMGASSLFLLLYAQGKVDSCRNLVDNEFDVAIGTVIVEYRETGGLTPETSDYFDYALDAKANVTQVCPGGFWPWNLPDDPPVYEGDRGPVGDTGNESTQFPDSTAPSTSAPSEGS